MSSATYKTADARANFSALLARAKAGEEITITKAGEPQARLVPPAGPGHREIAPLGHLNLPGDLFDGDDA
ncbi:MAG: type II toxin-antitoxin system prevent-host-death family antitoxin [Rhodospirillaceae bacterium]|nr:type II toxin-antitoxin system prevent-host-death family antitoxin [Rhodospirillaceae bacterium]MYF85282.1 type II toxin-antitoxin system prevent-host-death family antitoxin [Rhodospirillaceae bacterium]MYH37200.1 type II toxin-antitoxin system prevent-host-death family antitoxin [Rhodospirillaceae bacterium]MYK13425.1 type II toxin-antitoxin system prevent-host-death family antitoxin [Rhodospirillaceae bacterium]MYK57218.1 type II toxin-antitoxin system prevent-host-death family antitoxin [